MLASTSEIYGDPLEHPQKESYWGHVNPIGLRSVYDEAKRFAEALTMAYHRFHGINTCIVRIFNTYGPRMRIDDGRVVPNFLSQGLKGERLSIFGDGSQTRSFCYVDDLIRGMIAFMDSGDELTGPINMGNPVEFTMLELADIVLKLTNSKSKIVYRPLPQDDPLQRSPDITLAKDKLEWESRVSLEEGLKETIAYFESIL